MTPQKPDLDLMVSALEIEAALVSDEGRVLVPSDAWDRVRAEHGIPANADLVETMTARCGPAAGEATAKALKEVRSGLSDLSEVEFAATGTHTDDVIPRPSAWYRLRLVRVAEHGEDAPHRIAVEVRDITRTKSVQTALRSRERRLRLTNVLLRELSERDPLTALWNRRGLERALQDEHRQSRRSQRPLSALLIDCDDFKRVNDKYGHATGDRMLRRLAKLLRMHLRPRDLPGRIGGDEFLVLLPGTDVEGAGRIAERLRSRIAEDLANETEFVTERVTVSLGVGSVEPDTVTLDAVVRRTQNALKQAKGGGKNRVIEATDP